MRTVPLHDKLAAHGASFTERNGIEIVASVSDRETEYNFVRNSVGLTDFSYMKIYSIPEETGVDFLQVLDRKLDSFGLVHSPQPLSLGSLHNYLQNAPRS